MNGYQWTFAWLVLSIIVIYESGRPERGLRSIRSTEHRMALMTALLVLVLVNLVTFRVAASEVSGPSPEVARFDDRLEAALTGELLPQLIGFDGSRDRLLDGRALHCTEDSIQEACNLIRT